MSPDLGVVWRLPVRIFHWSLAAAVVLNLFVLEEGEDFHRWVGYLACLLVITRFLWGQRAGGVAKVTSFPLRWSAVRNFFQLKGRDPQSVYPGHHPVASWVYMGVWACILFLGLTGWMLGLDAFFGDDRMEGAHEALTKLLQVLIVLHLAGMAFDSWRFKRKTWAGMFHGRRHFPEDEH